MTAKARKLHNKRKINGTDFTELIGSDDENNDDTALHSDESFYSDDSDVNYILFFNLIIYLRRQNTEIKNHYKSVKF